jgi:cyclophilin family peptidyl-prolyl cis-trans isomerase
MGFTGWKAFLNRLVCGWPRPRPARRASRRRQRWPRAAWIGESLETRTLLSAVSIGALVGGNPAAGIVVTGGQPFSFDVQYDSSGAAETTNGEDTVTVRLHFDSTALTFNSLTDELTGSDLAVDPAIATVTVQSDASDLDGDATTDSFVAVTFISQSELPTPAALFTANFTAAAGQTAATAVNFTGAVDDGDTLATTSLTVDASAPQPVITGPESPTNQSTFDVTIDFGKEVAGFEIGDLVVANGTVDSLSGGTDGVFTATIIAAGDGPVTVDLPADVAIDAGNNGNAAAVQFAVDVDTTAPQPTIAGPSSPTTQSTFDVTIDFGEPVTGFESSDVVVTNGMVISFEEAAGVFTATIAPAGNGLVTLNIPADVAADEAGNANSAAAPFSVVVDTVAPQPAITGPVSPTRQNPFDVTINFGEAVTGFDRGDITVANGSVVALTETADSLFTATVLAAGDGSVTINIAAGVATDAAGHASLAATQFSIVVDVNSPQPIITGPASPTNQPTFVVAIDFGKDVAGFTISDIAVANGAVGSLSGGAGGVYAATIVAAGDGQVTLTIPANVAADVDGRGNLAGAPFTVLVDTTRPQPTIGGPAAPTNQRTFDVTINFGDTVTGFDANGIVVGNGTVDSLTGGTNGVFTATIIAAADGPVTVDVPAGVAADGAGNPNLPATQFAVVVDTESPQPVIAGPLSPTRQNPFKVTIDFGEPVTGFDLHDIVVGNGSVIALTETADGYTATILAASEGPVAIDISQGVAVDAVGNANVAAVQFVVTLDTESPQPVITGPVSFSTQSTFDITIDFGETVTGFEAADINVGNGTVDALTGGTNGVYSATITAAGEGLVTVDIAAGVAEDVDLKPSLAGDPYSVVVDTIAPQPVLSGPSGPIGVAPIGVSLDFGEDVVGFDPQADLVLGNAELTNVSGSNGSFTLTLRPLAGGLVTVDLPAGRVQDPAGNNNPAAAQFAVTVVEQDFGDAPASYGTLVADDGPRHFPEGPTLGTLRDVETDAQSPLDGTGDDATGVGTSLVTETIAAAPIVTLQTNFGPLSIQLDPAAAPETVANFLKYVTDGDYDNSIFHRLIAGFVLQGGGFTTGSETFVNVSQFTSVPTDPPVVNEFGRSNVRGTIAMAKLGTDPNSATSQFFFNLVDNSGNLDGQNGGFTVFGELIDLTLLDQLAATPLRNQGGTFTDLPATSDDMLLVVRFVGIGSASGTVYNDANDNGVQDAGEIGRAGVTIFADINDDGLFDSGDISATTGANGEYTLQGLPLGDVVIRQVPPASTVQSQPFLRDGYLLTTNVGSVFEGVDFGLIAAVDADAFVPGGDEDGVRISDDFRIVAGTTETATVTIQNSNGDARLYAWIDFNGDGDFADEGEQIADGTGEFANLGNGELTISFTVPTGFTGTTYARFRVSTDAGLGSGGEASDGEVEDYALSIVNPDTTAPAPTISGPVSPPNQRTFDVTVDFGEVVGGFDETDVIVGNGTVTGLAGGSNGSFTVTITAAADGQVTVDVPAGVAVDAAGNVSLAATQFAVSVDTAPPQPVISGPQTSNQSTLTVTIDFGETVSGFETNDVIVGNGTVVSLSGGTNGVYTVTMTASADGQVAVNVPAGAAVDAAGNASLAATQLTITVDATRPKPVFFGPDTSDRLTFTVTVSFGEDVTGFEASDITVGNGTVQGLVSVTGSIYTATVRAIADGEVTLDIAADIVEDSLGNTNTAAARLTVVVDSGPDVRRIAIGSGAGAEPRVSVFDPETGVELFSFLAYDAGYNGGVQVAVGDVNGDGVEDIITGPGAGHSPEVKVFDGQTGTELSSFMAFNPGFQGGVFVASGDVDNDGFADIIAGAGAGGAPHVIVFSGRTMQQLLNFFAYNVGFSGGVHVAAGDVNGDGFADIITGAGAGGAPHVIVFSGRSMEQLQNFFAYDVAFTGGVFVAAGDVNNDGFADIITGAGKGGGPHVRVFNGQAGAIIQEFFAYDRAFTGGVRVAAEDVNGDGFDDIVTGGGAGAEVRVFQALTGEVLRSELAFDGFNGGIFVG